VKNPILCLAVALLLLSGCQKAVDSVIEKHISSVAENNNGFIKYTIPKGQHYTTANSYKTIETSELKFVVRFDSSAIYHSLSEENQYDINKLYGFSDNNDTHHTYSARIGWSWTENQLMLYGYVYNEGKMTYKKLIAVPIGREINCSIKSINGKYQFYIDGVNVGELPRKSGTEQAKGYMLYPYFGGDETAPHDVNIWIKNL
jgi:hypothetical protein